MADYSRIASLDPGIKELLDNYFDILHFQDMDLFDKVFHRDCVLFTAPGSDLTIRHFNDYRDIVANRTSPYDSGNVRRERLLIFDKVSPTLAFVKLQLEMFGGVMQDYLNLVFLDGQWWVMAKLWERIGDAV